VRRGDAEAWSIGYHHRPSVFAGENDMHESGGAGRRGACRCAGLVLVSALAWPAGAGAQVPWGSEFRVNTYTFGAQRWPAVASDESGNMVVAWHSDGQDGSMDGVYAKRYDASGAIIGVEFRANSHTTLRQMAAAVASSATGDFVIVWQSEGQDGDSFGVFGRRYNALGTALGTEFQVNTYTTGYQGRPAVGADRDGNFMVVWHGGGDGDTNGIHARRYTAAGVSGPVFLVNEYTTDVQTFPVVAVHTDSESAVVWHSSGQDGSSFGIYGRRFSSTGVALGNEFRANTYTTGNQGNPAVAYRADGSFVVVWNSDGQDGSGLGIFARHVDAAGAPQGIDFPVNTTTAGFQDAAAVAAYGQGEFMIVWRGPGPGDSSGVFAQGFSDTGAAQGQEFLVNTYTTGSQGLASVAAAPAGLFTVVWGSNGQDGSSYGIYAQRLRDLIFEDGFE
jgi:hypothetical protein